jgi:vacuolar-type H+-ATPase subunit E/Vma4
LRTQADTILRDAREEAARAIAEARRLAENLVTRYEEYSTEAFGDAEARVEWLENQTRVMDSFSFELRSLSSTDVQVVLDEASTEGDIDKANAARG